uniref:WSC domain-containing protein n=1 Tax=Chromera velia CCMP2878 TaxID=1169474 RepID=A0A0G4HT47_9ALVE|eukprot:Cvel_8356.t1-p1 / transcript=Cvel_8356.t1 / gene=Cvel_8356 / organism=Chromera_velia_CCMP2878 / gene_product=hypothetical protein / transcript_product=hypothetical protein / location=Cvel_scaffold460:25574-45765(-) / protein_length=3045 / sequence_SO=supercontig / SO=protein_coding / is_pseudo=false
MQACVRFVFPAAISITSIQTWLEGGNSTYTSLQSNLYSKGLQETNVDTSRRALSRWVSLGCHRGDVSTYHQANTTLSSGQTGGPEDCSAHCEGLNHTIAAFRAPDCYCLSSVTGMTAQSSVICDRACDSTYFGGTKKFCGGDVVDAYNLYQQWDVQLAAAGMAYDPWWEERTFAMPTSMLTSSLFQNTMFGHDGLTALDSTANAYLMVVPKANGGSGTGLPPDPPATSLLVGLDIGRANETVSAVSVIFTQEFSDQFFLWIDVNTAYHTVYAAIQTKTWTAASGSPGDLFLSTTDQAAKNTRTHIGGMSGMDHVTNTTLWGSISGRGFTSTGVTVAGCDSEDQTCSDFYGFMRDVELSGGNPVVTGKLINTDPIIPLDLPSPRMNLAEFSIDGRHIDVFFDSFTIRGASPIDLDGDFIPDGLDLTTQHTGRGSCARMFDEATAIILGSAECEWISHTQIRIYLLAGQTTPDVGTDLIVKKNTIYTTSEGKWSMASTGGVKVTAPDPLLDPVPEVVFPNTLDVCSDLELDATSSYYHGGFPKYTWSYVSASCQTAGSFPATYNDLSAVDGGQAFIDTMTAVLNSASAGQATTDGVDLITIPAHYIKEGCNYTISVSLESRWSRTTTKTLSFLKRFTPAPTVAIEGPSTIDAVRRRQVALSSTYQVSGCADSLLAYLSSRKLKFEWTGRKKVYNEQYGLFEFESVSLTQLGLSINSATLIIPRFTLDANTTYSFTITLAYEEEFNDPDQQSTDTVTVDVGRSPVGVQINGGSRELIKTSSNYFPVDMKPSVDPDYPNLPVAENTVSQPCFPNLTNQVTTNGLFGLLPSPGTCTTDGTLFYDLGENYTIPQFTTGENDTSSYYCVPPNNLGTVLVNFNPPVSDPFDNNSTIIWNITGTINSRTAYASVYYSIWTSATEPLQLVIDSLSNSRIAPNFKLRLTAALAGTDATRLGSLHISDFTWNWQVFREESNPSYNDEAAAEAAAAGTSYSEDKFIFVAETEIDPTRDVSVFLTDPRGSNVLALQTNVLKVSTVYRFRVTATVNDGGTTRTGYAEKLIETCGSAPSLGSLKVLQNEQTVTDTYVNDAKTLVAEDFAATDLPVTYSIGVYSCLTRCARPKVFMLRPAPTASSTLTTANIPIGDAAENYQVILFVHAYNSFGLRSTVNLTHTSRPPLTGASTYVTSAIASARNADPESAALQLNSAMTVAFDVERTERIAAGLPVDTDTAEVPRPPERTQAKQEEIEGLALQSYAVLDAQIEKAPLTISIVESYFGTVAEIAANTGPLLESVSLADELATRSATALANSDIADEEREEHVETVIAALVRIWPYPSTEETDDNLFVNAGGTSGDVYFPPVTWPPASEPTDWKAAYTTTSNTTNVTDGAQPESAGDGAAVFTQGSQVFGAPTSSINRRRLLTEAQWQKHVMPRPNVKTYKPPEWRTPGLFEWGKKREKMQEERRRLAETNRQTEEKKSRTLTGRALSAALHVASWVWHGALKHETDADAGVSGLGHAPPGAGGMKDQLVFAPQIDYANAPLSAAAQAAHARLGASLPPLFSQEEDSELIPTPAPTYEDEIPTEVSSDSSEDASVKKITKKKRRKDSDDKERKEGQQRTSRKLQTIGGPSSPPSNTTTGEGAGGAVTIDPKSLGVSPYLAFAQVNPEARLSYYSARRTGERPSQSGAANVLSTSTDDEDISAGDPEYIVRPFGSRGPPMVLPSGPRAMPPTSMRLPGKRVGINEHPRSFQALEAVASAYGSGRVFAYASGQGGRRLQTTTTFSNGTVALSSGAAATSNGTSSSEPTLTTANATSTVETQFAEQDAFESVWTLSKAQYRKELKLLEDKEAKETTFRENFELNLDSEDETELVKKEILSELAFQREQELKPRLVKSRVSRTLLDVLEKVSSSLLPYMAAGEDPVTFTASLGSVTCGKALDLSKADQSFALYNTSFVRATGTDAYAFCKLKINGAGTNPFGWTKNSPVGPFVMQKLSVFDSNGKKQVINGETTPLKMLTEHSAFAFGSAVSTGLSLFAMFIDEGDVSAADSESLSLISGDMSTLFQRFTMQEDPNLLVVIVYCVILGVFAIAAVWGFLLDQRQKRTGLPPVKLGDGITGPLTPADPIAYSAETMTRKWWGTLWNLTLQEHIVLCIFVACKRMKFTRIQKVTCLMASWTGCFGFAALFLRPYNFGYENESVPWDRFVSLAFIVALTVFPFSRASALMFVYRPDRGLGGMPSEDDIRMNEVTRMNQTATGEWTGKEHEKTQVKDFGDTAQNEGIAQAARKGRGPLMAPLDHSEGSSESDEFIDLPTNKTPKAAGAPPKSPAASPLPGNFTPSPRRPGPVFESVGEHAMMLPGAVEDGEASEMNGGGDAETESGRMAGGLPPVSPSPSHSVATSLRRGETPPLEMSLPPNIRLPFRTPPPRLGMAPPLSVDGTPSRPLSPSSSAHPPPTFAAGPPLPPGPPPGGPEGVFRQLSGGNTTAFAGSSAINQVTGRVNLTADVGIARATHLEQLSATQLRPTDLPLPSGAPPGQMGSGRARGTGELPPIPGASPLSAAANFGAAFAHLRPNEPVGAVPNSGDGESVNQDGTPAQTDMVALQSKPPVPNLLMASGAPLSNKQELMRRIKVMYLDHVGGAERDAFDERVDVKTAASMPILKLALALAYLASLLFTLTCTVFVFALAFFFASPRDWQYLACSWLAFTVLVSLLEGVRLVLMTIQQMHGLAYRERTGTRAAMKGFVQTKMARAEEKMEVEALEIERLRKREMQRRQQLAAQRSKRSNAVGTNPARTVTLPSEVPPTEKDPIEEEAGLPIESEEDQQVRDAMGGKDLVQISRNLDGGTNQSKTLTGSWAPPSIPVHVSGPRGSIRSTVQSVRSEDAKEEVQRRASQMSSASRADVTETTSVSPFLRTLRQKAAEEDRVREMDDAESEDLAGVERSAPVPVEADQVTVSISSPRASGAFDLPPINSVKAPPPAGPKPSPFKREAPARDQPTVSTQGRLPQVRGRPPRLTGQAASLCESAIAGGNKSLGQSQALPGQMLLDDEDDGDHII